MFAVQIHRYTILVDICRMCVRAREREKLRKSGEGESRGDLNEPSILKDICYFMKLNEHTLAHSSRKGTLHPYMHNFVRLSESFYLRFVGFSTKRTIRRGMSNPYTSIFWCLHSYTLPSIAHIGGVTNIQIVFLIIPNYILCMFDSHYTYCDPKIPRIVGKK